MKKIKYLFVNLLILILLFSYKVPEFPKTLKPVNIKEVFLVSQDEITGMWYQLNLEKSKIFWIGKSLHGTHNGTLSLSSGKVLLEGNDISAGSFDIDMNTIYCKDLEEEPEDKKDLEDHLKSEDFFEVSTFPSAKFEIIKVASKQNQANLVTVTGNLTVKGVTKKINFDATLEKKEGDLVLKSKKFEINRTKWNIKYRSKSFFKDLKDRFIYDDISIEVLLNCSKKS